MLEKRDDLEIITFWKGRVALYAILKALDIGPGDAVILPGYTCMVVPSAVFFAGARPIYADVDGKSYNVTRDTLEAAWRTWQGVRPRAIIIQHTYGIPVEAASIIEWARTEGLAVIEDCAHVLGSSYRGIPCGQLGDAAFFSSQWNKPITTGLGGWAVSPSPVVAQKLGRIRENFHYPQFLELSALWMQFYAHQLLFRPRLYWPLMTMFRTLSRRGMVVASSSNTEFALEMPPQYAKRMTGLQERLLRKALGRAHRIITHRQKLTTLYAKELAAAGFELPRIPEQSRAVFMRYPLQVKNKARLLSLAQENSLELGDWFVSPVHPLLDNWVRLGYQPGSCPVAEELCSTTVNLPTHLRVTAADMKIVDFLKHL
jgi:perosamine synthetase